MACRRIGSDCARAPVIARPATSQYVYIQSIQTDRKVLYVYCTYNTLPEEARPTDRSTLSA